MSTSASLSEKDATIGRLYALRAGLSVVAQEKEAADKIMNKAERDKKAKQDKAEKKASSAYRAYSEQKTLIQEITDGIAKNEEIANSANLSARFIVVIIKIICALVFFAIAFIPFALMILIDCCYGGSFGPDWVNNDFLRIMCHWASDGTTFSGGTWVVAIIFTILGLAATGGLIALSCFILHQMSFKISYRKKKHAIAELARLRSELETEKEKINDFETMQRQVQAECNCAIQEADTAYLNEKEKATEHAVAGLVMINALEQSFNDIIDPRDWENTDLLIYALETRRAENMKEAFQVVDGERRTERIVEAVDTAGQEICKSINFGLNKLQNEMTRCFGVLGQLVVLQGDRIAGHVQELRDGIAVNNSYMAKLTTQQNMSNALLAKANKNSSELTSEIARLRSSAEYAEARLIYGTR